MARINIEKDLYTKNAWYKLLIAVGSPDTAIGSLVRAWTIAQEYWYPHRRMIPREVWSREGLNDAVIDAGLAQETDEGIYVNGCEEQFGWLFKKAEAGKKGGSKSAEARSSSAQAVIEKTEKIQAVIEKTPENPSTSNPPSLSPPLLDIKQGKIKPDAVINLFNELLSGKGRIQEFKAYYFPNEMLQMFLNTSGSPELSKIEQWREYFELVATRRKLLDYPATLKFLIKHDNALEILNGGYQDQAPVQKTNLNGNQDAQAMSLKLFDGVIRSGSHGLKDYLASLSQTEKAAIEKFGRASEILSCSDFQSSEIKNRLKNACADALKENLPRTG